MLNQFRTIQRTAIESMYEATCTIESTINIKDPDTNITVPTKVILVEDEPCRLSYQNVYGMSDSNTADTVRQINKLFIRPDLDIPAGSRIEVTQHGKTSLYSNSGYPEIHSSHQEIILNLSDRYGRL